MHHLRETNRDIWCVVFESKSGAGRPISFRSKACPNCEWLKTPPSLLRPALPMSIKVNRYLASQQASRTMLLVPEFILKNECITKPLSKGDTIFLLFSPVPVSNTPPFRHKNLSRPPPSIKPSPSSSLLKLCHIMHDHCVAFINQLLFKTGSLYNAIPGI